MRQKISHLSGLLLGFVFLFSSIKAIYVEKTSEILIFFLGRLLILLNGYLFFKKEK